MFLYSRLSTRYSNEIEDPSEMDRRYALADLFNEDDPGLSEEHYAKHPMVWLATVCQIDASTSVYCITVDRSGHATFQHWTDVSESPAFESTASVTKAEAIDLWNDLAHHKFDAVLVWFLSQRE